jgi:hypothetical protein
VPLGLLTTRIMPSSTAVQFAGLRMKFGAGCGIGASRGSVLMPS